MSAINSKYEYGSGGSSMPIDYKKYPENWFSDIRPRILNRANNSCENCGVKNHSFGYRDSEGNFNEYPTPNLAKRAKSRGVKVIRIVLTISHQDYDIQNNHDSNLKALCQRCHIHHDIPQRKAQFQE